MNNQIYELLFFISWKRARKSGYRAFKTQGLWKVEAVKIELQDGVKSLEQLDVCACVLFWKSDWPQPGKAGPEPVGQRSGSSTGPNRPVWAVAAHMNYHMTPTLSLRFAAKQYRTAKHEGAQQNDLA